MLTEYSQVPRAFLHCHEAGCPLADSCLRQLAYRLVPPVGGSQDDIVLTLNPHITAEQPCAYHLPDAPVRVARGFKKALRSVPYGGYQRVQALLTKFMSRNTFYLFRRGDKPIFPDVQEKILDVLRSCGAAEPIEFDAYEDVLDWGGRFVK